MENIEGGIEVKFFCILCHWIDLQFSRILQRTRHLPLWEAINAQDVTVCRSDWL